jgi:hypothetical protein
MGQERFDRALRERPKVESFHKKEKLRQITLDACRQKSWQKDRGMAPEILHLAACVLGGRA